MSKATIPSNLGALAIVAALATNYIRDRGCDPIPHLFGKCRDGDAQHVTSVALLTSGFVAMLVSVPFSRSASGHRARALWWHNSQFAR